MQIELSRIAASAAIGIGATVVMDLWNLGLKRAFGIPSLNYCLLGRWVRHMPHAFRHASIGAAAHKSRECATGWLTHYSIGVGLAIVFVQIASASWLARPTLLPAVSYGVVTVAFPFFVMQPALGLGIASAKTATPSQARLKSLATHTVYGLGMYLCALAT